MVGTLSLQMDGRMFLLGMRHNEVRDLIASMLGELCNDIEIEPMLQPLTGEQMRHRTTVTGDEARLDAKAKGFWRSNQVAFMI